MLVMELTTNNLTTIIAFLYAVTAPVVVKYLGFSIDEATFTSIIGFLILFINAKYPNTIKILGNDDKQTCNCNKEADEEMGTLPNDDDDVC